MYIIKKRTWPRFIRQVHQSAEQRQRMSILQSGVSIKDNLITYNLHINHPQHGRKS